MIGKMAIVILYYSVTTSLGAKTCGQLGNTPGPWNAKLVMPGGTVCYGAIIEDGKKKGITLFPGTTRVLTHKDCAQISARVLVNDPNQKGIIVEKRVDINNLAVLKLNKEIKFNDQVRPICLPYPYSDIPGGKTPIEPGTQTPHQASSSFSPYPVTGAYPLSETYGAHQPQPAPAIPSEVDVTRLDRANSNNQVTFDQFSATAYLQGNVVRKGAAYYYGTFNVRNSYYYLGGMFSHTALNGQLIYEHVKPYVEVIEQVKFPGEES